MVANCYGRHAAKARAFDLPLQTCVAQDIILTKVSASVYAGVSAEVRQRTGSPEPQALLAEMTRRVTGVFSRLSVPEAEARRFNQLVNEFGFEAHRKAFARN